MNTAMYPRMRTYLLPDVNDFISILFLQPLRQINITSGQGLANESLKVFSFHHTSLSTIHPAYKRYTHGFTNTAIVATIVGEPSTRLLFRVRGK
jgi:hypothetical protein